MLDGRVRARAAAVCAALPLVLTACGSQGASGGSPRSTGDLYAALPGTVSSIRPLPPRRRTTRRAPPSPPIPGRNGSG